MDVAYNKDLNFIMSEEALEEFTTLVSVEEYEKFFKHLQWLDDHASEAAFVMGENYFDRGSDPSLEHIVEYLRDYLTYFNDCRASKYIDKLLDKIEDKVKPSTWEEDLRKDWNLHSESETPLPKKL